MKMAQGDIVVSILFIMLVIYWIWSSECKAPATLKENIDVLNLPPPGIEMSGMASAKSEIHGDFSDNAISIAKRERGTSLATTL
jgi:hypothetical protein